MGFKSCSVKSCKRNSKDTNSFFTVKEAWLTLNDVGWKAHKTKFLCPNHFKEEDILGTNRLNQGNKPFIRPGAKPVFFSDESISSRLQPVPEILYQPKVKPQICKKVVNLGKNYSLDQLLMAAKIKLQEQGRLLEAELIHKINLDKEVNTYESYTPKEAFSLMRECNLTKEVYHVIRTGAEEKGAKNLYPIYKDIQDANDSCHSNSNSVSIELDNDLSDCDEDMKEEIKEECMIDTEIKEEVNAVDSLSFNGHCKDMKDKVKKGHIRDLALDRDVKHEIKEEVIDNDPLNIPDLQCSNVDGIEGFDYIGITNHKIEL